MGCVQWTTCVDNFSRRRTVGRDTSKRKCHASTRTTWSTNRQSTVGLLPYPIAAGVRYTRPVIFRHQESRGLQAVSYSSNIRQQLWIARWFQFNTAAALSAVRNQSVFLALN